MPRMTSTWHIDCSMPDHSADEAQQCEALMRDPAYIVACTESVSAVGKFFAAKRGVTKPFTLLAKVTGVSHATGVMSSDWEIECHMPHHTAEEAKQCGEMMQEPAYMAACTEVVTAVGKLAGAEAGIGKEFSLSGSMTNLHHH